jgi:hypothetical protein
MSGAGRTRRLGLDQRSGAVAYAGQVVALTLGCHREVAVGAVHGWLALLLLVGPVVLWVVAALTIRNAWRNP